MMSQLAKQYIRFVSQNILGMIGVSLYIIADTFFISKAAGANGITVLNLALPVYGVIFAIGSMIGIGAATGYGIYHAQGKEKADYFLFQGLFFICLVSIPFILGGIFIPDKIMMLMGGDDEIVRLGIPYTRTFLIFTPFFMLNYLFQGFVRNDNDPTRAMVATLSGSIFNIIFDYIFMFPMGLGLMGAAVATSISPMLGIGISLTHFKSKKNTLRIKMKKPDVKMLFASCQFGFSSFVSEISSAVITAVFNFLLLGLVGNIGVAAYGVIANLALVSVAVYNGISQGIQPLVSYQYGIGNAKNVKTLFGYSIVTVVSLFTVITCLIFAFTDPIISIFNGEGSAELAILAHEGLRIYFMGYIFAGINIVATGYLSATSRVKEAFYISMLRGFVAILACACFMSYVFGITGVWASFVAAEAVTFVVFVILMLKNGKK